MAILKIARMGHPVLSVPARLVRDPTSPEVHRLVADMIETMEDADGAGLAAPQVHVPWRVVIFREPGDEIADSEASAAESDDSASVSREKPLVVLINPEVEPIGEEMELGWEGCLSVPGLIGRVPRHRRIRYRGLTPEGRSIERVVEGFHARVVQHECDHLEGILYPQRMTDLSELIFQDQVRYRVRQTDAVGAEAV